MFAVEGRRSIQQPATDPLVLRRLRVLVADPVAQMAELTTSLLQAIGVGTIVKVTNSEEVLRALSQFAFSVVILDLTLKPLGPMEIAAIIGDGQRGRNAGVPIIAIGSSVYRTTVDTAIKAGIAKVIGRPVSADMLRWSLLAALRAQSAPEPHSPQDGAEMADRTHPHEAANDLVAPAAATVIAQQLLELVRDYLDAAELAKVTVEKGVACAWFRYQGILHPHPLVEANPSELDRAAFEVAHALLDAQPGQTPKLGTAR